LYVLVKRRLAARAPAPIRPAHAPPSLRHQPFRTALRGKDREELT
jgi:hypothetical protein